MDKLFVPYLISGDDNWSDIIVNAYIKLQERLPIEDFFLLHDVNVDENRLAYLFFQIVKCQYVVLNHAFFVALDSDGSSQLWRFFILDGVNKSLYRCDGSELILNQGDFEKRLSLSHDHDDKKSIQLYFCVKHVYQRYADYERRWFAYHFESAAHHQSENLGNRFFSLAGTLKKYGH